KGSSCPRIRRVFFAPMYRYTARKISPRIIASAAKPAEAVATHGRGFGGARRDPPEGTPAMRTEFFARILRVFTRNRAGHLHVGTGGANDPTPPANSLS